jgi:2-oxoisovalerate dehydrogenase E1 component alpha subunit
MASPAKKVAQALEPERDLVQFLDHEGNLVGTPDYPLTDEDLQKLYAHLVRARLTDEKGINLQRQGRIGFHVPATGEEAVQFGTAWGLNDEDWIFPSYRTGHIIALRDIPLKGFFDNLFGNAADRAMGRQMPVHWAFRDAKFVSISSPIGTHVIQAVGTAMAQRNTGDKGISIAYFGDGATSANDFHSGMNFAGVYDAPCVFVCTNNQYAITCRVDKQTASETIAIKAKAYGMPGLRVDGNDLLACYDAGMKALERARSGEGPTLIEALSYRMGGHSTSDDPRRYRTEEEMDYWRARDPIIRVQKLLHNKELIDKKTDDDLRAEIKAQVDQAAKAAESEDPPDVSTIIEKVFEEIPEDLRAQYEEMIATGGLEGGGHH